MKQSSLVTLLFLFCLTTLFSQPNKFGKITNEQWEIKECNFDANSNSLVLFDVGKVSIHAKDAFNNTDPNCSLQENFFTLEFERYIRIKILNGEGMNPVLLSFVLRSIDGRKDKLTYFRGISIWQENGIEHSKKFNAKILNKFVKEDGSVLITFELPDAKNGSIIDLNYAVETNIFSETPEWSFSNESPTLYSEINFSIPDFFKTKEVCEISDKLTHDSTLQHVKLGVSYPIETGFTFYSYSYNENHERYTLNQIPSSQKLNENVKFKYVISYIDFNSVDCNKGSFIKAKQK